MLDRLRKAIRVFRIYLACGLASISAANLSAQETNHRDGRTLVVGELLGRVDIREMKLPTTEGLFPVYGSGNHKPFHILDQTPNRVELEFNRAADILGNNPKRIAYKFYETERALISALILDEVDFAILESEESAAEVAKSNHHFLPLPVTMPSNKVKLICYNHRNAIFESSKVRMALAYAINHDRIIKKIILGGKANLAYGPFDSDSPLYNSDMISYKYDPKKAIVLLAQEGWRDVNGDGIIEKNGVPFKFDFYYRKGLSLDEQISRQIKISLIQIGIEINPKPLTKIKLNNKLASHEFDAVLMDRTFEENVESLEAFFSDTGMKNYMGYHNSTFQNYLKFFHEAKDPDRKVTLIKGMQRVVNRDQPVTFLYFKWWTHYVINVQKFGNFRDDRGRIRPFDEWIIKTGGEN
ncbi:hypothetical protein GWO43_22295 [candidate division KSB1 bacterium]|nr:hypothetical protein [candidate division KSB1 bacterium]NIR72631.1 hypothetical protein [candidate division KSB1 bacterium]NIS27342.1 hypothetical protein [candidate division KSB1 bacterium]NIT73555.1 hypothetical protein [candidate division KSB1 bacterium]NIU25403.1 hypothetical protein [candidate division KSB1 bacterium]